MLGLATTIITSLVNNETFLKSRNFFVIFSIILQKICTETDMPQKRFLP